MKNLVEVMNLHVGAVTDSGRKVEIIRGISFSIAPDEIVALIGESGSGKTTTALTLMGYTRDGCAITGGHVFVDGYEVSAQTEHERANLRGKLVSYVPQSAAAAFNPSQTILTQVIEIAQIHKLGSRDEARRKAIELFRALALPNPETIGDRYPHQVSGGQLQRLAAAMALIGEPKVVIFDEPTTALDVTTQIEVLRAFKKVMQGKRIAGVYVSHDLAVVAQIADRILVLRNGEVQEAGDTRQILHAPAHPYTKTLIAAYEPVRHDRAAADSADAPVLEARNLSAGYGAPGQDGLPVMLAVNDVSFTLKRGSNLGVIGESGCGKSTLARVIAGLLPPARGEVLFNGKALPGLASKRSKEELRHVQIVFQLADTALNPARSVSDILGRPLTFYHGTRGAARNRRIDELMDMVRLPRALKNRLPGELSGGQKQRVNFARALAADPSVVLCDEITSALDTVVAAAVTELLQELQRELGLSYIFISHDLNTVRAICDEVVVMYGGRKVEQLLPGQLDGGARHPYSQLLISSVPQLDPGWLDNLKQNAKIVEQFAHE
ncbi:peptide/nickel transport system ATP-binding protein [Pseudochelatococcus lubricantis]|uniref:Peptide/nickel transport system ATP-binding protein n=1 Tax=Pseudochelatococcus lubricantis TaxID=1538102 RepID=A0ABX0UYJ8_9HYPH|nr:ABC transporter ATP-binding protein [Pseudochelatococcus lubricantis]NIJ58006.1 peptide/nickel transport system ATP-binding protein [Pseudochelatococcus lubricantis]